MVSVRLEKAVKRFNDTLALGGVDLDIASGSFFFLLGPSGCGKTTLLRALAGLEELDEGLILFDDKVMNQVPAHRRNTGLVFQSYALWPHMTVFENVAFGLVERRIKGKEKTARVEEALRMVQLEEVGSRLPAELSGGQQQRVALARALVIEPDLVLLDEPLSNLDAQLRHEMRYELKRIQAQTGITMIYVTHDQKEALSMAHEIALMDKGRIRQVGTPQQLYQRPKDVFVARFVGQTNLVEGKVKSIDGPLISVETPMGLLLGHAAEDFAVDHHVCCSIRPEAIRQVHASKGDQGADLGSVASTEEIVLVGNLTQRLFLGEVEERFYRVRGIELKALELMPKEAPLLENQIIELAVNPDGVVVLSRPHPSRSEEGGQKTEEKT